MPRLNAAWIVGTELLSFCGPMFPFGMIQISLFRCRSKDVSVRPKPYQPDPLIDRPANLTPVKLRPVSPIQDTLGTNSPKLEPPNQ
jgi:hypothetical protein